MNKEIKNYNDGVILGRSLPTTYVAGTIPFEERNLVGNWEAYCPPGEWQKSNNGDSKSCVSFSAINSIETQEKFLTGKQVNYSDRWIAKMSGTTRVGNYLDKVAETIRKYGLVLESSYPTPETYTWEEYHTEIPESLMIKLTAEGREWLKKWDIKYEETGIDKLSLQQQLKQSPLQTIVPGHAIESIASSSSVERIFDSYEPFIKDIPPHYSNIIYSLKIILYKKEQALDPDTLFVDIKHGDSGRQVEKLLNALEKLGWHLSPKRSNVFVYDDQMVDLVFRFQRANFPDVPWWSLRAWTKPVFWEMVRGNFGGLVGPAWRELINSNLSQKHG